MGRGGGGGWLGPPSSYGPPMVPTEGGPKILKLKSSWPKQNFRCQRQTLEGEERGGGFQGGHPPFLEVYGSSTTSLGTPPPPSSGAELLKRALGGTMGLATVGILLTRTGT